MGRLASLTEDVMAENARESAKFLSVNCTPLKQVGQRAMLSMQMLICPGPHHCQGLESHQICGSYMTSTLSLAMV